MDTQTFETGYDPETYVANLRNYRTFVKRLMGEASARSDHVTALVDAVQGVHAPVRATMMTEDWCGDSACNTPILADLFSRAGIEFRVFRGSEQTDLKQKYNSEGATHIPVVSLWDGSGRELARWIEAPAVVDRKKTAWKKEHPEFTELYDKQKTDTDAAKRFATLYRQFIEEMAEWYMAGDWDETTREIVEQLQASTSKT
ncbi:MAG: thioredoxin family protein [Spirochaetaceae bacterium]